MQPLSDDSGVRVLPQGEFLETVTLKGLQVSLVASGDGTEIIHHRLTAGSEWAMGPTDGWDAMECIYILSGSLIWKTPRGDKRLRSGDSLSVLSIQQDSVFQAETTTDFLYVCSQPIFYLYSKQVTELMGLAISIEEKDGYTFDHCERIKKLSSEIGRAMNLSPTQLYDLNMGAFFHDVGKTRIPESILSKPGQLTVDEWIEMRRHTTHGKELLLQTGLPYLENAAEIIEQHHERANGSGYPHGLRQLDIRIESSIIAVVDSFDAMTTDRPYHRAKTKEDALAEMRRCRDTLYHADVVDVLLRILQ